LYKLKLLSAKAYKSRSTLTDKFHYQQMQYYYKLPLLPRHYHGDYHWLLGELYLWPDLMLRIDWLWLLKFLLQLQLLLLVELFLVCV